MAKDSIDKGCPMPKPEDLNEAAIEPDDVGFSAESLMGIYQSQQPPNSVLKGLPILARTSVAGPEQQLQRKNGHTQHNDL
jgi:hypothetical protein